MVKSHIQLNGEHKWCIRYKHFNITGFASSAAASRHFLHLRHMIRMNAHLMVNTAVVKEQYRRSLFGIRIQLSYCSTRFMHPPLYATQIKTELIRLVPALIGDAIVDADVQLREYLIQKVLPRSSIVIPERLRVKYRCNDIGILQKSSFKELYRMMHILEKMDGIIESRKATVVGYIPTNKEHCILFDDASKPDPTTRTKDDKKRGCSLIAPLNVIQMKLDKEKGWSRIPWEGNLLDASNGGEHSVASILPPGVFDYGPECPRCFAHLGVGISAWEKCSFCKLLNPGSAWSVRFHKTDENAWIQPNYTEEVEEEPLASDLLPYSR